MIDERFRLHRLKATRLACIAGSALLGGWYFYYFFAQGQMRHDLLSVLLVIAAVKLGAMFYYRKTD